MQTHFKPTESFQYTHFSSCHPSDCKKGRGEAYMYSCFIYRKNFIFCFSHFESHPKTVNIQGYSELKEPIRTYENCYPLIWWILILVKTLWAEICEEFTHFGDAVSWGNFTQVLGPSMEPDSHCFLTLITKHQSFGIKQAFSILENTSVIDICISNHMIFLVQFGINKHE